MTADRPGRARSVLARFTVSSAALAALPLVLLTFHRQLGENALLVAALVAPVLVAALHLLRSGRGTTATRPGFAPVDATALAAYLTSLRGGRDPIATACLVLAPDGGDDLSRRLGPAGHRAIMREVADRLRDALRGEDIVAMLDGDGVAIALAPASRLSVESAVQTALRLQRCLQVPFGGRGGPVALTASIGIALSERMPDATGDGLLDAARAGLDDALAHGPRAIRLAGEAGSECPTSVLLARDLDNAFDTGQIVPYFQPQICTDTGALTGLEALARWEHPTLGLLGPGDFLPTIEAAQALPHLTDAMIALSLDTLRGWEAAGLVVPRISINFALADLVDPDLPDRIAYALDRADLAPARLGVEVLETVLALQGDGMVESNLARLRALGCHIDLDDFGTGNSSIANIRRFAIDRLKIDRSFVRGIDSCREAQAMVAAMLTMADHLGLDVLAEGVETGAEHAMLSQLGCAHVQGFGPGRPMAGAAIPGWVARRRRDRLPTPLPRALRHVAIGPDASPVPRRRIPPRAGKTA